MSKEPILEYVINLRKQHCDTYLKSPDMKPPYVPGLLIAEKQFVAAYKNRMIEGEYIKLKQFQTAYEGLVAEQMAQNAGDLPKYYLSRAQEVVRGSASAIDRLMGVTR